MTNTRLMYSLDSIQAPKGIKEKILFWKKGEDVESVTTFITAHKICLKIPAIKDLLLKQVGELVN